MGYYQQYDYQGAFNLFKTAKFDYLYSWEYSKGSLPNQVVLNDPENLKPTGIASDNNKEIMTVAEIEEISKSKPDTKTKINHSTNPEKIK